MAYSKAVYSKAYDILDARRANANQALDALKKEIYEKLPRTAEIEKERAACSIKAAKAVFAGGDAKAQLMALSERSSELKAELEKILTSNGYSADALEIKFFCSKCSDKGTVEVDNSTVYCDCFKQILKECACEEVNNLSPLSLSVFSSFDLGFYPDVITAEGVNPRRRMFQIFDYCKKYAENFTLNSRSLLMRGATGLGKTHLSLSIANELLQKGFSVVYVSAPDILYKLERAHFSYNYDTEDEMLSTLSECDLLIIDDLGTEFASAYSNTQIYNIFNNRILRQKPVILNTNLTIKELEKAYSQRFVSRIIGSCDRLDFVGKDVRALKD